MKRILILSLLALVTFCFAGCSGGDSADPVTTGTITVKATYTGAAATTGDGKVYVYLYKTLGSNAQTAPDYQGSIAATSGTECTITIPNIAPDTYYAVVFYDSINDAGYKASADDPYMIYNSPRFTADAKALTVSAGSSETLTVAFTDIYELGAGGVFNIPSIVVKTKYNGTLTTETGNDNIGKIHVYIYSSWPANAQVLPAYSGKSQSVVADSTTQNVIAIGDIPSGSYYVLVFYDYKIHASNLAGNTDRYIIYNSNDTTYYTGNIASEATTLSLSSVSTQTLIFDFYGNNYVFGSSGSFQATSNPEP